MTIWTERVRWVEIRGRSKLLQIWSMRLLYSHSLQPLPPPRLRHLAHFPLFVEWKTCVSPISLWIKQTRETRTTETSANKKIKTHKMENENTFYMWELKNNAKNLFYMKSEHRHTHTHTRSQKQKTKNGIQTENTVLKVDDREVNVIFIIAAYTQWSTHLW